MARKKLRLKCPPRAIGQGTRHIDPSAVNADVETLRQATSAVERYGTKRVAHLDVVGPTDVPTFEEIEAALELLRTLLKKSMMLLKAVAYHDPVRSYDWKAIFREPWIPRAFDSKS